MQCYRTPLHSSVTVSLVLMDIKHGAEEKHKHNWVSEHLQGRNLAPYICVRTHNCHKITRHYWADRMDSTYCCLMASWKNMGSLLFKDGEREDAWVSSCPTSCPPSFAESKNLPIQLHFKLQFPVAINSLRLTAWNAAINDWHTHTHTLRVRDRPVTTAARTRPECKGACSSDVGGNRPLLALAGKASISSIIKVHQYFSVQVIWSHNYRWKHISENM